MGGDLEKFFAGAVSSKNRPDKFLGCCGRVGGGGGWEKSDKQEEEGGEWVFPSFLSFPPKNKERETKDISFSPGIERGSEKIPSGGPGPLPLAVAPSIQRGSFLSKKSVKKIHARNGRAVVKLRKW